MFEVGLASVCDEINEAFRTSNFQRAEALLWPALDQFNKTPQLWFYAGNIFFKTGRPALSAICFERAIELDENPLVLANLGAAYRRLNQHEEGLAVLRAALERNPDYEPALVNLGAMYVNEGSPELGIPHLEKAVALGQARGKLETGAEWNLGLLYLEASRFAEGFDIYRGGYGAERLVRTYAYGEVPEPKRLDAADHQAAQGVGSGAHPKHTLIVWGEQGIGDEMMFATCLNQAIEHYDIVLECHPRLEKLHRNSTWARKLAADGRQVRIYPTRKDENIGWPITENIRADFKCPIGDLASFYRRDIDAFHAAWRETGPTYAANPVEATEYRQMLHAWSGGRPIVCLATHGGVLTTARQYRTLRIPELEYLLEHTNCFFVGLDYDDMTPVMLHLDAKFPGRYRWYPSIVQHWDYDHTAALLAACDMNVMVCQSAFHMSAGMGLPTRCLVPKRCAWRYAPIQDHPELSYWYPGDEVRLYRQEDPDSWAAPLNRLIADINALRPATKIFGRNVDDAAVAFLPEPAISADAVGSRA